MITLPLSNDTELSISINLIQKAVTIRQRKKGHGDQSLDPVISIPLVDLKELAKSIKTIVSFLS